jgi:chromosome partitioning protein
MRVIGVTNQKGGVGKTTTVVNLGAGLNNLDRKVLIVDMDPQGNATTHLGFNPDEMEMSIYDVLKGTATVNDAKVEVRPGLDLIPSNIELSGAEIDLVNAIGRERLLKDALSRIRRYDYVLIDCPPSLGLLTINALVACKEVFIALQPEFFALKGVRKLLDTVTLVKTRMNRRLDVTGVIICLYDKRRNQSK